MSQKKSMEEVSIKELIENYNLIVPEIQREYVWGLNFQNILDTFFIDIKEGYNKNHEISKQSKTKLDLLNELLNQADSTAKDTIKSMMLNLGISSNAINIGFLYSYRPDYYVYNDINKDVYLIDGQQRFTTLFLLLFYLSIKENRKAEFEELFRYNKNLEHIAFDYRVRTLTHNFFIDLISNVNTISDLVNISSKNWFLSNYKNDVTIKSIVGSDEFGEETTGTFKKIDEYFKDETDDYFDYIQNHIKFWHFKTEETSQGEELYITMNSRGQQLADNENIRAKLFESNHVKVNQLVWSKKWEEWQDFFWKKRNKKFNKNSADKGFNEFLRWVVIVEMIKDGKNLDSINGKASDLKQIIKADNDIKLPIKYLNIEVIEKYFNSIEFLYDEFPKQIDGLSQNYNLYKRFDLLSIDWLSPKDNNINQNQLFRLLPILHYTNNHIENIKNNDVQNLFRVIRFFYNLRQDATVGKTPDVQLLNAIDMISIMDKNQDILSTLDLKGISISLLNDEENLKFQLFKKSENRLELENLFWVCEDYKETEGRISHVINLAIKITLEQNEKFSHVIFKKVLKHYKELINNENKIWGNFINTDVYYKENDRILASSQWFRKKDFLNCVYDRFLNPDNDLDIFFKNKQKDFLKKYNDENEIASETSSKIQLYIYYILNTRLEGEWNWNGNWNFGIYKNSPDSGFFSLFNDNQIYQKYNQQWRYSYGYNTYNGIWTQHNFKTLKKNLTDLLNWSKI